MSQKTDPPPFTVSCNALYFPPPHNRRMRNIIRLTNDSKATEGNPGVIVYKLRGVNPDAYVVRPKSKCVAPGSFVEIAFTRIPEDEPNSSLNTKKEGFQLEVALVPASVALDAEMNPKAAWSAPGLSSVRKVFFECIFDVEESKLPSNAMFSVVGGDEAAVSPSQARGESEVPSGPSGAKDRPVSLLSPTLVNAGVAVAATTRLSYPPPANAANDASKAAEEAARSTFAAKRVQEETLRKELQQSKAEVAGLKSKVASAEETTRSLEGKAADIHHRSTTQAPIAPAEKQPGPATTKGTVPVSIVVFLMMLSYFLGAFLRVYFGGPLSTWFDSGRIEV
jgi:hypothetical protein